MQAFWQWVLCPVVGAVIGYLTNAIAVRMLFRPYQAKRVGKRRIPFTPGVVARERENLARAVGDVLDGQLLNASVLEEALLSAETLRKASDAVDGALASVRAQKKNARMMLSASFGDEHVAALENEACVRIRDYLLKKLLESGLETQLAALVVRQARARLEGSMGVLATLVLDERRTAQYEAKLSQAIREKLAADGPDFLDVPVADALREAMTTPIGKLVEPMPLEALRAPLLQAYEQAVHAHLHSVLEAVDLGGIVQAQLNAVTPQQLEAMFLAVTRKELRAIVRLGALLGALLGLLQAFLTQVL